MTPIVPGGVEWPVLPPSPQMTAYCQNAESLLRRLYFRLNNKAVKRTGNWTKFGIECWMKKEEEWREKSSQDSKTTRHKQHKSLSRFVEKIWYCAKHEGSETKIFLAHQEVRHKTAYLVPQNVNYSSIWLIPQFKTILSKWSKAEATIQTQG